MPVLSRTYIFLQPMKPILNFLFEISNKSIILFLKVVSSSSKNTNNPPPVYVNNKYM